MTEDHKGAMHYSVFFFFCTLTLVEWKEWGLCTKHSCLFVLEFSKTRMLGVSHLAAPTTG